MSEIITDSLGRKISIKKPSTLERINFFRVLGSEDCSNNMILAEFSNAMWVTAIDDKPTPKKQSVDIEYICSELDKSNANELILKHRVNCIEDANKDEKGETNLIKK